MTNQDGEVKDHGDCRDGVILAIVCWNSGQIKKLCDIH